MEREQICKLLGAIYEKYDYDFKSATEQHDELKKVAEERDLTLVEMFELAKLKDKISYNLGAKNAICEILLKV